MALTANANPVKAKTIDPAAYGRLLSRTLPRPILSEKENERIVAELERLDTLDRPPTTEEKQLAGLLAILIRDFEGKRYSLGSNTPRQSLQALMEFRGLRQRDMVHIFGSRAGVSEALSGKRAISKTVARKLADFFHVSVDLFI
jgi:HTH-type transcriptional regulator/antitoxin HigA